MLNHKEPEKVYYSIREVQKILNLPASTLRFWETKFPQLQPVTNDHKTRYYTKKDIELLRKIKFLREEQHLAIPAVQNKLQVNENEIGYRLQVTENLKKIRKELVELRAMM